MSCCGQKRANWRQYAEAEVAAPPQPPELQEPIVLFYLEETSLLIKGQNTGIAYLFSGQGQGLSVDSRDVNAFLEMKIFSKEK